MDSLVSFFRDDYWFKVGCGIAIVCLPFLIALLRKKISWQFFVSWMLTTTFVTLTFFFLQRVMDSYLDERKKLYVSIILGFLFFFTGVHFKSIQSPNTKKIGWMLIGFGILWILFSF